MWYARTIASSSGECMFDRGLPRRCAALGIGAWLLLAASGCGDQPSMPADQVIQKAAPAIQATNSFHFTLETGKLPKAPPGIFITGVDGKNQFWTDPTSGKWGPMPSELDMASFFDPSKGVSDILANVKGPTSDGTEKGNDADTYRLKGSVPATALKSLSPEVTATGDLTTTLWVGTGDFLLRRVQLEGPLLSGEPPDLV